MTKDTYDNPYKLTKEEACKVKEHYQKNRAILDRKPERVDHNDH